MLNNKGQSLVLFVLIIPILLGIMALVYDVGMVIVEKNKLDNVMELVIDCALDEEKFQEEEVRELLNYNLPNHNTRITIENGEITLKTSIYVKGVFSSVFGFQGFSVESEYVGYMDGTHKREEKIK